RSRLGQLVWGRWVCEGGKGLWYRPVPRRGALGATPPTSRGVCFSGGECDEPPPCDRVWPHLDRRDGGLSGGSCAAVCRAGGRGAGGYDGRGGDGHRRAAG